jgi:anti-anti-sigma factor
MIQLTLLSDEGSVVHIRADGPICQARSPAEGDPLEGLLGLAGFGRSVLLDLEHTDYIDSGGISWLIINHKRCQRAGGRLVLHTLPPRVSEVLHFCRMESIFHLAADEAAARALVPGEGPA